MKTISRVLMLGVSLGLTMSLTGCLEMQKDMSMRDCRYSYIIPEREQACMKGVEIAFNVANAWVGDGSVENKFKLVRLECLKVYPNLLLAAACVDGAKKFRKEASKELNKNPNEATAALVPQQRDARSSLNSPAKRASDDVVQNIEQKRESNVNSAL